ncbi:uncharacterized protein LOC110031487 [Phalaenopsis equestris]|uniref:uncharacterized protein LOC110031487 n=1 Tax=Phalaenopsis equestris TaxID=78828 RepID=UPI0009E1F6B5|nr:uncharacterized protein LOC110031487 [Phalaenopsis equestris]
MAANLVTADPNFVSKQSYAVTSLEPTGSSLRDKLVFPQAYYDAMEDLKLVGNWKIRLFDSNHVMIHLTKEEVYAKESTEIVGSTVDYCQQLMKCSSNSSVQLDLEFFISDDVYTTNSNLTEVPSEEEIKQALSSIDSTKSTGPDGFTSDFYKKGWDIIKDDVVSAIQCFFQGYGLPNYFCFSTIAFVPKSDIKEQ